MNTGAIHAVTAFVCMLQILLILKRSGDAEYREAIDVPFCKMLCFFTVFCFLDAVRGIFAAAWFGTGRIGFLTASYGYHIAASLSGYVGIGYGLSYVKAEKKDRKALNFCRMGILLLQTALLIYNLAEHNVFWVDMQGRYCTGKPGLFLYGLQQIYFVTLMIYAGCKWYTQEENRDLYRNAFLFASIPLIFGIGQYLFMDTAMYSMGFALAVFVLYLYGVAAQREIFIKARMSDLDRMQTSIIHGLAGNFVAIYYVDLKTEEFDIYRNSQAGNGLIKDEGRHRRYFDSAIERGKQSILSEDQELFQQCFSRQIVERELEKKNQYSFTVRIPVNGRVRYFQYRFMRPVAEEEKGKLIVGVYDVDEEIRGEQARQEQIRLGSEREERLKEKVYIDALTGLYNRRAYEDAIKDYETRKIEQNFVYLSIDLNGLKTANDGMGHEAGDELLKGAAFCLKTCLGAYGKIYRTGGDEFVAMICADHDKLYEILTDFDRTVLGWSGERVKELTMSYGFVSRAENAEMDISEIAKLADKRMYQDKEDYYANRGIDRRGQQEAYDAICNSYIKILKINLTTERFSLIRMGDKEKEHTRRPDEGISVWLQDFKLFGQVHEEDRENYLKNTDIDFLRDFFRQGNKVLALYYRRKIGKEYKHVMLEMIPAKEYTHEEQTVFLYEKNIDR